MLVSGLRLYASIPKNQIPAIILLDRGYVDFEIWLRYRNNREVISTDGLFRASFIQVVQIYSPCREQ